MGFSLSDSIESLPKVGRGSASLLTKLGINKNRDLLFYFPFRYEDLSNTKSFAEIQPGEIVSAKATLWQVKTIRTRSGKFLTTALLNDGTASVEAVWFNQPYLEKTLKASPDLVLAGKASVYRGKLTFIAPTIEKVNGEESLHTARLVPVYPQTAGINSKWLRGKIKLLLDELATEVAETLPKEILLSEDFPPVSEALYAIHFPKNLPEAERARKRFAFEELLSLQLANLQRKSSLEKIKISQPLKIKNESINEFLESLPFKPTASQTKAIGEILLDLRKSRPMNRLLQGEVGSGKTLVAAASAFVVHLNKQKTLFMAPTEILAKQHFQTLRSLFAGFPIRVGLATGSEKFDTEADIVLGTSALLNLNFEKEKIGLIVIDEQHRFGVEQRRKLREKQVSAHLLTLSATPIPRTMALIFFGELDLSVLDEMPSARQTPKTFLVPKEKRTGAYDFIKKHVKQGEQAFIICPLIEESETLTSVRSVKLEWEQLSKEVFPEFRLGLLHGKLASKEKNRLLEEFKKGKFPILVTTPVVEVGIDIPKATVILIEASERFGLASLHQLRGRVGRNELDSFCLLFTESSEEKVLSRLKNMEKLTSGFSLAEADLAYRGPGQVFGTLQHGLPDLRVASFTDSYLIQKTREIAEKLFSGETKAKEAALKSLVLNKEERAILD